MDNSVMIDESEQKIKSGKVANVKPDKEVFKNCLLSTLFIDIFFKLKCYQIQLELTI